MLCPKVGVVSCPAPLDGAPPACLLGLELGRQEVARVRLGLALSLGGVLQAGGRRVWPWPWPWFPWRDVRGFELQISVNVDYGIWLRFSLPFPSSPAPCWALGPAGGWTSAACHLILRQVSAHPTAQGLSPWQEPPTRKGVRRKGGAQPGPREAGGIPGFSHAASHTPREQVDGPSSQVTSFCPCLCRCLCCLGFGFPI